MLDYLGELVSRAAQAPPLPEGKEHDLDYLLEEYGAGGRFTWAKYHCELSGCPG